MIKRFFCWLFHFKFDLLWNGSRGLWMEWCGHCGEWRKPPRRKLHSKMLAITRRCQDYESNGHLIPEEARYVLFYLTPCGFWYVHSHKIYATPEKAHAAAKKFLPPQTMISILPVPAAPTIMVPVGKSL